MKLQEQEIPYAHVRVHCNSCGQTYFVKRKELKHRTEENKGCFPCEKCGSHDTTWIFRQ